MGVGWTHTLKGAKKFAKIKRNQGYSTTIKKLKQKVHGQTHYAIYSYKKKKGKK